MDIMLEVTRKCNLKCSHCVRGSAQNKSISDRVLFALRDTDIGILSLTGGEPSLVPGIFRKLIQYQIFPDDIWLCTNGAVFKKKFFENFIEYYKLLKYPDVSGFSVSVDCYHPSTSKDVFRQYEYLASDLGYDELVWKHNQYMTYDQIRNEGRAADMGGIESCDRCCEWKQKEIDGDKLFEGYGERKVYITVDGDVLYGSMWSYKRMQYLSLGNITKKPLESILEDAERTYRKRYARYTKTPSNELKWRRK